MNIPENFVNRLKAWRDRNGLTQGEAARKLGVTRTYLSQIENGRDPGRAFLKNFLTAESEHSSHPSEHLGAIDKECGPQPNVDDLATATRLRVEARSLREMADRLESEALAIEKRHGFTQ